MQCCRNPSDLSDNQRFFYEWSSVGPNVRLKIYINIHLVKELNKDSTLDLVDEKRKKIGFYDISLFL